jgi:hypothetical protein
LEPSGYDFSALENLAALSNALEPAFNSSDNDFSSFNLASDPAVFSSDYGFYSFNALLDPEDDPMINLFDPKDGNLE